MRRHLFNLTCLLSSLLCVATVALWVRSYHVDDGFVYARQHSISFGRTDKGKLCIMTLEMTPRTTGFEMFRWGAPMDWERDPVAPGAFWGGGIWHDNSDHHFLGFHVFSGSQDYVIAKTPDWKFKHIPYRMLVFPFWFPFIATILLPALPVLLRARRWLPGPRPPGSCSRYGYNLTGNTSGVCPECGTPVPQKSEATA